MLFFITLASFYNWAEKQIGINNRMGIIVHHFPDNIKGIKSPVVTVGTFDGVHLGHRSILQRLREMADRIHGETVLMTFDPHPRIALGKDADSLRLLNTPEEKASLLESLGIDHIVVIPFTKAFSMQDEHTFIRTYLVDDLAAKILVIGYNHRFGHNREGGFDSLKTYGIRYGFEVEEMPKQTAGDQGVSSTQIRKALLSGDIALAAIMLGYDYSISGEVVDGDHRGRLLGFPTANLLVNNPYKLIPAPGVYAVRVDYQGMTYGGMCNIGSRPTFGGGHLSIEVHIFNFNKDIYHHQLKISFVARLRDEKRFNSAEDLRAQLLLDAKNASGILEDCP